MLNYRVKKNLKYEYHHSSPKKLCDNNIMSFEKIISNRASKSHSYLKLPTSLYRAILCKERVTSIHSLSPSCVIFFMQIISLYQNEVAKGFSYITYSSKTIASMLGYYSIKASNMRSFALKMISSLEKKGLLLVTRNKDSKERDHINKIIPIIPDDLFLSIKYSSPLHNQDNNMLDNESNLDYILRTKLFVPIKIDLLTAIFRANIPASYKLFIINSYISAYRNYQKTGLLSFSNTAQELINKNIISSRTLSRIVNYLKNRGDNSFIKLEHKYAKSNSLKSNRWDKSIYKITIEPSLLAIASKQQKNLYSEVTPKLPPTNAKITALIKKDTIRNKNIAKENYYDEPNISKKIIENEIFSSTSSKNNLEKEKINSSIPDTSDKVLKFYPKRTLKDWYPLSKEEVGCINWDSGREFSTNFANQLLLKLSKSNNQGVFPTKYHLRKYLTKVFKNELRQGPDVNLDSFKLKCNLELKHAHKTKISNHKLLLPKTDKEQLAEEPISNLLWRQVCERLKSSLGKDVHRSWTGKLKYVEKSQDNKLITLKAPSRFIGETIKDRYNYHLRDAFRNLGMDNIEIIIDTPIKRKQELLQVA